MIDATPEYLLNVLDADTAKKVWRHLRGVRIYFPKCKSTHDDIRTLYSQMGTDRATSIKRLSELFDLSIDQIRRITKEQRSLFEEN